MENISPQLGQQLSEQLADFYGIFEDPITRKLLVNPFIISCGHTLSKKTLDDITVRAVQIGAIAECPLDHMPITSSIPNLVMQEGLGRLEIIAQQIGKSTANLLGLAEPVEEFDPMVNFPGVKARFECSNKWKPHFDKEGAPVLWTMSAISLTDNSFLAEFEATAFKSGNIMFSIICRKGQEEIFKKYMSRIGLTPNYRFDCFTAHSNEQRNLAWSFVAKHNAFNTGETRWLFQNLVEADSVFIQEGKPPHFVYTSSDAWERASRPLSPSEHKAED